MHIVLFRYSARVVKLKYLYNRNVVIIAPEVQRKKYEDYPAEGNNLPKVIFLEDFILPNIILEIRRISQNTEVESITTLSEEDMDIVGFLNDHFVEKNTHSVSNLLFKDKYFMRSFLVGVVNQPYFRLLESENDLRVFWNNCKSSAAILKPRNEAGSNGIKKVYPNEKIDSVYFEKNYIIEEYIDIDNMITCDGYSIGSEIKRFYVHEYEELLFNTLSSSGYYLVRTSSLYNDSEKIEYIEKALEECRKVLNVFSINSEITPFHFEWFLELSTGKIVFCEVGKRFGGGDIPQLIEDSHGVDVIKEYWDILTNSQGLKKINFSKVISRPANISATFALYRKQGKVIEVPDEKELAWAKKVYIFIKPNTYYKVSENVVENSMLVQFNCKNSCEFEKRLDELKHISQKFKYVITDSGE
ncbi:TPA: acetyl-CoA carboxylase biotin carboxylase subunit family protein [Streptococcus pneumoniae]